MRRLRYVFPFVFFLAACGGSQEDGVSEEAAVEKAASSAVGAAADTYLEKWARSCALCHVTGVGGAPRMGVGEDWQPRVAQGKETLLEHTIEGFNNMPPLGYCMSCEREDFVRMIEYMAGTTL